jgi:NAD(P)-dependent dehydrogenase (short-subunit alcohol dehydrogenase family)
VTLSGEVALVTGAASGIGRACVAALLARGAAVVGLDLNPAVATSEGAEAFLGLVCELTDEAAVKEALARGVAAFKGLSILVLNAGVFPPSTPLAQLPTDAWERVLRVNLTASFVLLREAHAHLKRSPTGGKVVVIGSKNVAAPGPGAAAYSASKAALTQLARVAALEWGKDHIRVNVVHPDAVFDTGLWSQEVLAARARHYGISVQAYKTRNLLKTEVTSRDVAELVAALCSPLFARTTGAQIPIDGGNERVI